MSARVRTFARRSSPAAYVLAYHAVQRRVSDPALDRYALDVSTFRQHLRFLKKCRKPIRLSELVDALSNRRTLDPRWCVLTFDDALQSQTTIAAEELAGEGFPWALAVPAGSVESRQPVWTYALRLLLLEHWREPTIPHPTSGDVVLPTGRSERAQAIDAIVRWLRDTASGEQRARYVDGLRATFGAARFDDCVAADGRFMPAQWSAIRALADGGVELLAHGFDHYPLNANLEPQFRHREIVDSKALIEQRTGMKVAGFVLPNGIADATVRSEIQQAGYAACLTSQAMAVTGETDRFSIGRLDADCPLEILRLQLS